MLFRFRATDKPLRISRLRACAGLRSLNLPLDRDSSARDPHSLPWCSVIFIISSLTPTCRSSSTFVAPTPCEDMNNSPGLLARLPGSLRKRCNKSQTSSRAQGSPFFSMSFFVCCPHTGLPLPLLSGVGGRTSHEKEPAIRTKAARPLSHKGRVKV